jgi:hypothetical protein
LAGKPNLMAAMKAQQEQIEALPAEVGKLRAQLSED